MTKINAPFRNDSICSYKITAPDAMSNKDKVWIYFNSLKNASAAITIGETDNGYK